MLKGIPKKLLLYGLVIIFLTSLVFSQEVDKTREPEASGTDVIKATVDQIRDSQIYPDVIDKAFLRRLAYVESNDGSDPSTYRTGYHGGVWQVDEVNFDTTKTSLKARSLHHHISSNFKINWIDVEWIELRKPLYSAIAATLFIYQLPMIPHISDIIGQASYWKRYYDTNQETQEKFIDAVEAIKKEVCKTARLDVAFVMDSSGSIKEDPYVIARDFIKSIVQNFDIGQDRIRVGLLQFEAVPTVEFLMNRYYRIDRLLDAIGSLQYKSGGATLIGAAIDNMVTELFAAGNGARNKDDVPRIAIVLSDGKSSDGVLGPANTARAAGITVFVIGIGGDVEDEELQDIANDPDERYLFRVQDFDVIDNIRSEISQGTCEEPTKQVVGQKLNSTLNTAAKIYLETDVPPSGKITFTLNTTGAKLIAYLSTKIRNPNQAFHQWNVTATHLFPMAQVYIDTSQPSNDTRVLYGTIVNEDSPDGTNGSANGARFSALIEEGDTRIVTTTILPTIVSESPKTDAKKIPAASVGLSTGSVAGISVAVLVPLLALAVLTAFFIKRHCNGKPDPILASADVQGQSNTLNVYGDVAGTSTADRFGGVGNDGMTDDFDFVKPGKEEIDSKPINDNVYSFEQSNLGRNDDDDIYVITEFDKQNTVAPTNDDVYEVTAMGQDDVYEVQEFP